ncbi:ribonucleases P/MRP protein subunit POP1-like [Tropilaelaps mercedesae]|uniref:Ribonucleases P/MRP protein subunit POP1-like n=1 Tax=Tropilaelaps mercedesae TaxID=418985 RepID=A0A1V9Y114_9ACAR|nr:ribonucleases P/MRP protein subunit POP1-like [Tropilaelaps mercedesae]
MSKRQRRRIPSVDVAVLEQPLNLGGSDAVVLAKALRNGTAEIQHVLINECSVVLECRVCRALFRSLANLLAHKRHYCRASYAEHSATSRSSPDVTQTSELSTTLPTSIDSARPGTTLENSVACLADVPAKSRNQNGDKTARKRARESASSTAAHYRASGARERLIAAVPPANSEVNVAAKGGRERLSTKSRQVTSALDEVEAEAHSSNSNGDAHWTDICVRTWHCFTCHLALDNGYRMRRHLVYDHGTEVRYHVCPHCGLEREYMFDVMRHLHSAHGLVAQQLAELRNDIQDRVRYRPRPKVSSGMSNRRKRPPSGHAGESGGDIGGASKTAKLSRKDDQTATGDAGPSRVDHSQPNTSSSGNQDNINADILSKIDLPMTVDLERFVSARKDELANLTEVVKTRMRKLVSQQLPRHLRRRTVSHNKKRLPKRLQDRYNAEAAKVTKRPSRLHRRRPRNLQDEYTRRARKHRWLETHLWHAKRFRMVEKFGYKIPERSFDKSLRACYRGAAKYCLLNDISYECCIELRGEQISICAALGRISSPRTGLSVAAKKFTGGRYQGSIWLYQIDSYPHNCLGEVTFIWRPPESNVSERTLWLWCHPALRDNLIGIFKQLFDLAETSDSGSDMSPVFKGPAVTLTDRRNELNRFRLTGPLSVRVLCETLTQDESGLQLPSPLRLQPDYFNKFWKTLSHKALSAFAHLRDGQIAGNVVLDPRLHMPNKRIVSTVMGASAGGEESTSERADDDLGDVDDVPYESDLWDTLSRSFVKSAMLTQDQINKMRHDKLVPGTPVELGAKESRIPILIVFRGGAQTHLGYSRGCDVLLPAGWGRQFFIALNYRSARAAGLRDLTAVTRYSGRFVFPDDVPDSPIAAPHLAAETDALLTKHMKYPPNKRPPFAKLGMSLPYSLPFAQLVDSFSEQPVATDSAGLFVLRDRALLKQLAETYAKPERFVQTVKSIPSRDVELALVPVKVTCPKGVPGRFARLYALPAPYCLMREPAHTTAVPERTITREDLSQGLFDATIDNLYQILGFLVCGDRNYTEKCATGLGYVSLNALMRALLVNYGGVVAFRNQHCFNYRTVQMSIVY